MALLRRSVAALQVYALTQRTQELEGDRDRILLALEQTEAAMIGRQQELSLGAGSHADQVSVSADWLVSEPESQKQTMSVFRVWRTDWWSCSVWWLNWNWTRDD